MLRLKGEHALTKTSHLTIVNHLIYIRALSRVLVDLQQFNWNREKSPEDQIYLIAAGSNNITSDYDVTVVGKNASELCSQINVQFRQDTGKSLAD